CSPAVAEAVLLASLEAFEAGGPSTALARPATPQALEDLHASGGQPAPAAEYAEAPEEQDGRPGRRRSARALVLRRRRRALQPSPEIVYKWELPVHHGSRQPER